MGVAGCDMPVDKILSLVSELGVRPILAKVGMCVPPLPRLDVCDTSVASFPPDPVEYSLDKELRLRPLLASNGILVLPIEIPDPALPTDIPSFLLSAGMLELPGVSEGMCEPPLMIGVVGRISFLSHDNFCWGILDSVLGSGLVIVLGILLELFNVGNRDSGCELYDRLLGLLPILARLGIRVSTAVL